MLIALSAAVCAEGIMVDKEKDGYRIIQTDRTPHVFLVKGTMNDGAISLDIWEKDGIKQYSICIYFYTVEDIEKNAKLLLKFGNDEILELKSSDRSTTQRVGTFPIIQTLTYVSYPISREQLQKVMSNNVVKLRVETSTDHIDGKVYGKKFTNTICNDYALIEQALQQENSLYDDF